MIITGDIAAPHTKHNKQLAEVFVKYPEIFAGKTLVCNFEGLLNDHPVNVNEPVLYNHPGVIESLTSRCRVVAALANNHILDLPGQFTETINAFKSRGVLFAGADFSPAEAAAPAVFYEDEKEVLLFNACWSFLMYNHSNPSGGVHVAEIREEEMIRAVSLARRHKPGAAILVFLHWNFDLETLPFPMHRQFAKALIDAGANLVVGAHSHCVQGGEKHGEGYIVYGLGNFFMPHGVFAQGKLAYPKMSETELVLQWSPTTNTTTCHWFCYSQSEDKPTLTLLESVPFESSERLLQYSPFWGMTEGEYLAYFKKNRRKKILIPVFTNFRNQNINRAFVLLLKARATFARFLAKRNIIKWQS